MALELNNENFAREIAEQPAILVDFWAPWCGPCRALAPILEEAESEVACVTFAKLNVDDAKSIAISHGVQGIPTLILFREGKEVDRNVGLLSKDELVEFIQKNC